MQRRSHIVRITITIVACFSASASSRAADAGLRIDFEQQTVGRPPAGFTLARTGPGDPGQWVVQEDSGARVLAQTSADRTSQRFPLAIYNDFTGKDVDLSVRFKPISGRVDQAAGLVWRYRDPDNYYIVRANALEGNVVLYKVQNGKRTDLPLKGRGRTYGTKAKVPRREWSQLRVVARGDLAEVYLNGQKLFEVEDNTFPNAGNVGLWTKADSVTLFDDLQIKSAG
jgi:hypothetical protein